MSEIDLDRHIDRATQALLAWQRGDGHFLFELEADATVPDLAQAPNPGPASPQSEKQFKCDKDNGVLRLEKNSDTGG